MLAARGLSEEHSPLKVVYSLFQGLKHHWPEGHGLSHIKRKRFLAFTYRFCLISVSRIKSFFFFFLGLDFLHLRSQLNLP